MIENAWFPTKPPFVMVALILKVNVPNALGVPEITPVDAFRLRLVGSAPKVTAKV